MIDDESFAANLTNEGGVDGTFRLLRNVGGLWLLHECRRGWAEQGSVLTFDELVSLAADGAAASLPFIDPTRSCSSSPATCRARISDVLRVRPASASPATPARSSVACSRASPSSTRETVDAPARGDGRGAARACT